MPERENKDMTIDVPNFRRAGRGGELARSALLLVLVVLTSSILYPGAGGTKGIGTEGSTQTAGTNTAAR